MAIDAGKLRFRDVRRRFDRAAASFDQADFVHRSCFDGLIERLTPLVIEPSLILDLGCATGSGSRRLARQFKKSRVIALDASATMLEACRSKRSRFAGVREVQADAMRLPLRTGSVDLVFSNLLLPWIDDLPACFAEIARVLRRGGVFAFSTLGSDSLAELRASWDAGDQYRHVNEFADMHDVGDALLHAGLADPVLDVDQLRVTYRDVHAIFRDLTACGARNALLGRRKTLTGKNRFHDAEARLFGGAAQGELVLHLELVFGHAFGTGPGMRAGEYRVAPDSIGRRRAN